MLYEEHQFKLEPITCPANCTPYRIGTTPGPGKPLPKTVHNAPTWLLIAPKAVRLGWAIPGQPTGWEIGEVILSRGEIVFYFNQIIDQAEALPVGHYLEFNGMCVVRLPDRNMN